MGFLANHPKSTVGDLARSLNLDPEYVAVCLAQLSRTGEIHKAADGYSTGDPPM
jgi:DNA-binding MarR family transcriptional regulator